MEEQHAKQDKESSWQKEEGKGGGLSEKGQDRVVRDVGGESGGNGD